MSLSDTTTTEVSSHGRKARSGLRTDPGRAAEPTNGPLLAIIVAAAAVWTAVVGGFAVWRHQQFLSHRYDLGNMVQAVWSTANGRPLETTDASGEQIVRLGSHVDPILAAFAPFWLAYPHPELLIVGQAALLASGLYPVVRLAGKYVGGTLGMLLLGAWYLVFPWMLWSALNDFHAVTLAIPLLLYAIWFLDEHRLGLFAVFASLAILTGELIGLTVAALGVWYAIRYGRRVAGLSIAALGASWTLVCLLFVVPAFNDGDESRFYSRYATVGGSPSGLVRKLVEDPGTIVSVATTNADLAYVVALLAPTAFLALAAPLMLAVGTPQLALNLLSDWWSTTQPQFQYSAALIPVLIAASIMAMRRFHERFRVLMCAVVMFAALATLAADPPRPGAQDFVFASQESPARRAAMRDALALIPEQDPVTASNRLGAHLSGRRVIHLFPVRAGSRWVVLDLGDPWLSVAGEQDDRGRYDVEIDRLERDPRWTLIYERESVRVYQYRQDIS